MSDMIHNRHRKEKLIEALDEIEAKFGKNPALRKQVLSIYDLGHDDGVMFTLQRFQETTSGILDRMDKGREDL